MSHCMGVTCETHQTVILPDGCPERGCPGGHGYNPEPCNQHCPKNPAYLKENGGH